MKRELKPKQTSEPKQLTSAEIKLLSEKLRNFAVAKAEYYAALDHVECRVGPLTVNETGLRVSGRDAAVLDLLNDVSNPSEITLKQAETALSNANDIKLWGLQGATWREWLTA